MQTTRNSDSSDHCEICRDDGWVLIPPKDDAAPCPWCQVGHNREFSKGKRAKKNNHGATVLHQGKPVHEHVTGDQPWGPHGFWSQSKIPREAVRDPYPEMEWKTWARENPEQANFLAPFLRLALDPSIKRENPETPEALIPEGLARSATTASSNAENAPAPSLRSAPKTPSSPRS